MSLGELTAEEVFYGVVRRLLAAGAITADDDKQIRKLLNATTSIDHSAISAAIRETKPAIVRLFLDIMLQVAVARSPSGIPPAQVVAMCKRGHALLDKSVEDVFCQQFGFTPLEAKQANKLIKASEQGEKAYEKALLETPVTVIDKCARLIDAHNKAYKAKKARAGKPKKDARK